VCNTKSRRGNKYIVGIIDMFTGRSWTIPSPSNSAADVIRIITHWRVQTVNNKPIGMIMTDNASWAVSDEWTNAVDNMQTPQRKCGAYASTTRTAAPKAYSDVQTLCVVCTWRRQHSSATSIGAMRTFTQMPTYNTSHRRKTLLHQCNDGNMHIRRSASIPTPASYGPGGRSVFHTTRPDLASTLARTSGTCWDTPSNILATFTRFTTYTPTA
jgi:hypothetical protein